jgi:hypothetical protein
VTSTAKSAAKPGTSDIQVNYRNVQPPDLTPRQRIATLDLDRLCMVAGSLSADDLRDECLVDLMYVHAAATAADREADAHTRDLRAEQLTIDKRRIWLTDLLQTRTHYVLTRGSLERFHRLERAVRRITELLTIRSAEVAAQCWRH